MLRLLLCLLCLTGCRRGDKQCAAMEEQLATCASGMSPRDLRPRCDLALTMPPEAPDAAPSLAELERRAFVDCVKAAPCEELLACLQRHGCTFVLTSPTDREPKLWCHY